MNGEKELWALHQDETKSSKIALIVLAKKSSSSAVQGETTEALFFFWKNLISAFGARSEGPESLWLPQEPLEQQNKT